MSQEENIPHPVKVMNADVFSREAAKQWLGGRVRRLIKIAIVTLIATPAATAITVIIQSKGFAVLSVGELLRITAMWCAILYPILGFVTLLLGIKRFKIARRVGPILKEGIERRGKVEQVEHGSSRKGGVNFYRVTVTVVLDSGDKVTGGIVESEGTDLPLVETGGDAITWTLGDRSVIGAAGALFESMVTG